MSKTTKALAILGVVAGLGVSALPLSAMAATDNDGMTIMDGTGTDTTTVKYDGTADKKVSDTVTVKTSIADTLSLTVQGDDDANGEAGQKHLVLLGTDGVLKNGESASGVAKVIVSTNNFSGYSVNMKGANGTLKDATTSATFAPVGNNTVTFPTSGNDSAFGYKVTKEATFENLTLKVANWNPVKTTTGGVVIAANEGATVSSGDEFSITFQAYASPSQASGDYEEVVTITATANI